MSLKIEKSCHRIKDWGGLENPRPNPRAGRYLSKKTMPLAARIGWGSIRLPHVVRKRGEKKRAKRDGEVAVGSTIPFSVLRSSTD